MKVTPKQKMLIGMIDKNMQRYAGRVHRLNEFAESHNAEVFANNISELVDMLGATVEYAKDLEIESYHVAEDEKVANYE